MNKVAQNLKSHPKVYHKLLLLYIVILAVYGSLYAYSGLLFLFTNCAILFFISMALYIDFNEPKYEKIITLWIQISATYAVVLSIIILGWGYGFELFLLELIAIYPVLPIKNSILKFFIPIFQLILFIVLYFTFSGQDINYGSQTLKHISFLFCFSAIALTFILLQDNKKIYTMDIINTQKENISYKNIAEIDYLTGLYNRTPMNEIIAQNFKMLSKKQIKSLAVILCDIDNFKSINDTYGHIFGDKVLSKVAEILHNKISKFGKVSRWGGEEFLAIIPAQNLKKCIQIIETARVTIHSANPDKVPISATFGLLYTEDSIEIKQAISIADNLLYRGKNQGKNQVVSEKYEPNNR
ncbi:GGDEF domain-containing protein [Campylobacter lanienae]|uniref:GGDEF domain-containing protein n=1 Tax=Campylobacter lanienae TaxID=75658 RepID=UPI002A90F440|nr:GGDEF domain-containing protein [Campylobacter lanienae]MDY6134525.1 GGDEF domain-containing protein [Campylobacter lanienae]